MTGRARRRVPRPPWPVQFAVTFLVALPVAGLALYGAGRLLLAAVGGL